MERRFQTRILMRKYVLDFVIVVESHTKDHLVCTSWLFIYDDNHLRFFYC